MKSKNKVPKKTDESATDQKAEVGRTERIPEPESPVEVEVELDRIDFGADTQSRPLNDRIVDEYAEIWKSNESAPVFPPVDLFQEDQKYYLADGFHRVASAKKAGRKKIMAWVLPGGRVAALKSSLGSNESHGKRRTAKDKRYAVDKALQEPEFRTMSDRAIAEICRVSPTFAGRRKKALEKATVHVDSSSKEQEPDRRRGRDGKIRRVPKSSTRKNPGDGEPEETDEPTTSGTSHTEDGGDAIAPGNQEAGGSNAGASQGLPPRAEVGFDPKLRWKEFRAFLEKEYTIWPPDFRPILVQNVRSAVENWEASASEPILVDGLENSAPPESPDAA